MTVGLSLHLGLNSVDPVHYQGWSGQLEGCHNDASDMAAIAHAAGFTNPILLLSEQCIADQVLAHLRAMCQLAKPGDLVLFTNSSHGGQLPDLNHDESDYMDETLVMYDREIVDDQLAAVWATAKPGVRILMVSDSCHSGTIVRAMGVPGMLSRASKELRPEIGRLVYEANKDLYDPILSNPKLKEHRGQIQASVLQIGACMDSQTAYDGDQNGLFTENLLRVLKGNPKSYGDLVARVRRGMPSDQSPDFRYAGPLMQSFVSSKPFAI